MLAGRRPGATTPASAGHDHKNHSRRAALGHDLPVGAYIWQVRSAPKSVRRFGSSMPGIFGKGMRLAVITSGAAVSPDRLFTKSAQSLNLARVANPLPRRWGLD